MDVSELVAFVRERTLAVVATLGPDGFPQAALVGMAATERGELVFDASASSRKVANIRRDPRIAAVVGWEDEVTMQVEGRADVPQGADRDRCLEAYFLTFPGGRERARSADITHIRVVPGWLRYSDFRPRTRGSQEIRFEQGRRS
jgi:PPOX class probable F420-dependent enzyme